MAFPNVSKVLNNSYLFLLLNLFINFLFNSFKVPQSLHSLTSILIYLSIVFANHFTIHKISYEFLKNFFNLTIKILSEKTLKTKITTIY